MRNYEVAYISDSDLEEQAQTELEERVHGWIEAAEGKVVRVDRWGRRRLAYPINKKPDGFYVFIHAQLPPGAVGAVERDLKLNESVLRFMVTAQEPEQ